jgi:hypothetical protein
MNIFFRSLVRRSALIAALVVMACAQNLPKQQPGQPAEPKSEQNVARNAEHKQQTPWGYWQWQKNEGNTTVRIMAEMGIKEPRTGGVSQGTEFYIPFSQPVRVKEMHGNISYTGWCKDAGGLTEVNSRDGDYLDSVKLALNDKTTVNLPRNAEFPTPVEVRGVRIAVFDDLCKPVTWSWDLIFTW